MISRETLENEFTQLVEQYYPPVGKILSQCYVKIIDCNLKRQKKRIYYLVIYYPQDSKIELISQQKELKDIAENMGLVEVIYLNATRIIRDPLSSLKRDDFRLWLELHWIATRDRSLG